jgi:hypothetical protein
MYANDGVESSKLVSDQEGLRHLRNLSLNLQCLHQKCYLYAWNYHSNKGL